MKHFMIEFNNQATGVEHDFLQLNAESEEKAIQQFNKKAPTFWKYIGIRQLFFYGEEYEC